MNLEGIASEHLTSILFLNQVLIPLFDQILVVIEPLLIDEDYYARVEGREIISNLAKVRLIISF